jgi:hypothetical protein
MASNQGTDLQIINDAIQVLRGVQARAPRDFLTILAILLGAAVILLLLIAVLAGEGFVRDSALNLCAELFGAWFTVALINGLWHRLQVGIFTEYEAMVREMEKYRGKPLSEEEREAWQLVIESYRSVEAEWNSGNVFRYLISVYHSNRRARDLEMQGNRVLQEFSRRIKVMVDNHQDVIIPDTMPSADGNYKQELAALREEISQLRTILEARVGH